MAKEGWRAIKDSLLPGWASAPSPGPSVGRRDSDSFSVAVPGGGKTWVGTPASFTVGRAEEAHCFAGWENSTAVLLFIG